MGDAAEQLEDFEMQREFWTALHKMKQCEGYPLCRYCKAPATPSGERGGRP